MKKHLSIVRIFISFLCIIYFQACSLHSQQPNTLSDREKKEGWTLLFDGKTMNGWHLFNRGNITSAWSVDSGNLICNPHTKNVKHGDLVTDNVYQNFDLQFEWKISKAGNSGVFINVQERPELGTTFSTGPEYQLLDDKNVEKDYLKNGSHKAAAIFGVIPNNSPSVPVAGGWNQSRILQQNGKLTFWLNGVLTVEVDLQNEKWKKSVAASPMNQFPEYGRAIGGHIAVQDWTNGVSFRNMKIRELDSDRQTPEKSAGPEKPAEVTVAGSEKLPYSDTIELSANENMRFNKELFRVKAGQPIRLLFKNTAASSNMSMAHNVVVLKAGTDLADFAEVAAQAKNEQYIPSALATLIVAHTRPVNGGESDEVEFTFNQPGVYDFICSYPGHWGTMQGKIVVE